MYTRNIVSFRHIIVNILHKYDNKDNSNNNNLYIIRMISRFYLSPDFPSRQHVVIPDFSCFIFCRNILRSANPFNEINKLPPYKTFILICWTQN
jgi:hypothetical protein